MHRGLSLSLRAGLVAPALSCAEAQIDEANICFIANADRIEAKAYVGCASDHRGAELSCEIDAESDGTLRMTSSFSDGNDPNDACAGPLVAPCTSTELPSGDYTVFYGEDAFPVNIPDGGSPDCADMLDV